MAALTFGTSHAATLLGTMTSGAYLSLHTADPGATGANEVTGGSYARLACAITVTNKTATNDAAEDFTGMPAATVTHVGIWSASSGGTFRFGGALTSSQAVLAGQTFTIAAGDLDIALP